MRSSERIWETRPCVSPCFFATSKVRSPSIKLRATSRFFSFSDFIHAGKSQRKAACSKLLQVQNPFAPVPRDQACTQIYGGPQEAIVVGVYGGKPVWARFTRVDGCQIARWNRVRFLFPIRVGIT